MTTTNLEGTDNMGRDGLNTTAEPDRTAPPAGPAHATVTGRRCGPWTSVQPHLTTALLHDRADVRNPNTAAARRHP
jgi:hypothetical protein